ncbi:MAG: peptide chain release factor N(5)-glutamine methyltransferase [Nocardioides sp.]
MTSEGSARRSAGRSAGALSGDRWGVAGDLSALLATAAQRLAAADVASPEHDAAQLLAHVLGIDRGAMLTGRAAGSLSPPTAAQVAEFDALLARRIAREPLQHLTGVASFRYVDVSVGPGVFVPRPETELLAGWAIDRCHELDAPVVVDLCTGSGVIAKAIAHEAPHATVYAVELSESAHEWAARNLAGTDVVLIRGDMAEAVGELDGTVDVITCNPPYIPLTAWESVAIEARDHDPELALFAGEDGLAAIRVLQTRAATLLRRGGVIGVEHADAQGGLAQAIFLAGGRWDNVRDHLDLAGRPRFLTAKLAR